VEGEFDALSLVQNGFPYVVATRGTNGLDLKWLEGTNIKKVWMCFDNDEAGRERGIKIEKRRARVAFRCQKKLFDSIEEEAAKRKLTVSALIVEILSESLLPPSFESLVRQNPPI
jgi:DNA primase